MIDLGPHAAYIVASYAGVAALIAALIAYVRWDARSVERRLKSLEARGIRRRSAQGEGAGPA
jgi:heme exporter protein D